MRTVLGRCGGQPDRRRLDDGARNRGRLGGCFDHDQPRRRVSGRRIEDDGRAQRLEPCGGDKIVDWLRLGCGRRRLLERRFAGEQRRMAEGLRHHVLIGDHDPHAEFCGPPQPRGEFARQANAAVRGRNAGQNALVHGDARPRQPLHEKHRRVVIKVRAVPAVLLDDAEHAGRRRVVAAAGRDRRLRDANAVAVERDPLMADRDHELKRAPRLLMESIARGLNVALLAHIVAIGPATAGFGRVRACRDDRQDQARRKRLAR